MADDQEPEDESTPEFTGEEAPIINVTQLFGDRREVCLELDGVRYRLRITRRNKLILQK